MDISFDNSYARLPPRFFAERGPTPVAAPRLVRFNQALADELGLEFPLDPAIFVGNRLPEGAHPIAQAYAGHQFGHFSPQLGDGRAILLGEFVGRDGVRRDIQLKGAGTTPFSRAGDGRAALGPVLREYIVSEAMAAMGIPTTRALAAATTGEIVYRETRLPGAVLTRIAASHIRVGTFQYFAAQGDTEAVRLLADHVIARHYPELATNAEPYRALIEAVAARQAALVAQWLLVGFIHGVMNTDNTSIAGETIDYGPCAFLDVYDPAAVFSSIDHGGRYAYANQPRIAHWNLVRLAETLLPLLGPDEDSAMAAARDSLAAFAPRFQAAYLAGLRRKIGLTTERDGDEALTMDFLKLLEAGRVDFTRAFRTLSGAMTDDTALRTLFADSAAFDAWVARWRPRLSAEPGQPSATMRAANPAFIPRNHLVEATLAAAVERADFVPFETLLDVLSRPYADDPERALYAIGPREEERVLQTFCGT